MDELSVLDTAKKCRAGQVRCGIPLRRLRSTLQRARALTEDMIARPAFALLWMVAVAPLAPAAGPSPTDNPAIDMQRYLRVSFEAARYREDHRLSEDAFIRMSKIPGTIVLDARSREKYDALHIKGAFPTGMRAFSSTATTISSTRTGPFR